MSKKFSSKPYLLIRVHPLQTNKRKDGQTDDGRQPCNKLDHYLSTVG